MPRGRRWTLVLLVLALAVGVGAAVAQPAGGGAAPTPGGPATRPPLIRDFDDIVGDPRQAFAELYQIISDAYIEFADEYGERIEENVDALPAAVSATVTRVLALVLGAVLLIFPDRTKVWSWMALGAVLGLIVAQIPLGDAVRLELFRGNFSFLSEEEVSTLGLVVVGAFAGLALLTPAFYVVATGAGALAGAAIAAQATGGPGGANVTAAALAGGAVIGFVLMTVVVSRIGILVPLAIGAGLVVLAAGLSATVALPIMIVAGFVAVARSAKGRQFRKRENLPSLELKEGKVDFDQNTRKPRQHLHEVLPAMADDRDNPLIKR